MRRLLMSFAALPVLPRKARWLVLRCSGIATEAWNIAPGCFFAGHVEIGRGTYVNRECLFDGMAPIRIGPRCAIGMRAAFITSSHEVGPPERRAGDLVSRPVTVGAGCWIGSHAVLLPGVTVGDGCIIASGAVVHRDCTPHSLYGGVPARLIRSL
jgi:maltose O-acetyltransferase